MYYRNKELHTPSEIITLHFSNYNVTNVIVILEIRDFILHISTQSEYASRIKREII